MKTVSEDVQGQIATLEAREKMLSRRGKQLLLGSLLLGVLPAGCAYFIGLADPTSSIDVPAQVQAMFRAGDFRGFSTVGESLGKVVENLKWVTIPIAVLFLLFTFYRGITEQLEESEFVAGVMAGGAMLLAPFVFSTMVSTASLTGIATGKDDFDQAVKEHDYAQVLSLLKKVKMDATPAGRYVLAQVSLAGGRIGTPVTGSLINEILAPTARFEPKPAALYAIEVAAYGEPRSPSATAYQEEIAGRHQWFRKAFAISAGACFGLLLSGALVSGLRLAIRRRLRRIHGLLGAPQRTKIAVES